MAAGCCHQAGRVKIALCSLPLPGPVLSNTKAQKDVECCIYSIIYLTTVHRTIKLSIARQARGHGRCMVNPCRDEAS